jgi:hypothetical protein
VFGADIGQQPGGQPVEHSGVLNMLGKALALAADANLPPDARALGEAHESAPAGSGWASSRASRLGDTPKPRARATTVSGVGDRSPRSIIEMAAGDSRVR